MSPNFKQISHIRAGGKPSRGSFRAWAGAVGLFILLATAAAGAARLAVPFGSHDPAKPHPNAVAQAPPGDFAKMCRLCREDPGVPVVPITPAVADSLGWLYSGFNETLVSHMDSLLEHGRFGEPGSRDARRVAHLLTRMLALNSLHYMVGLATNPNVVYEASEASLREAFKKYTDPGVYPIARMARGRMGLGMVCVQYDLAADMESTMTMGSQTLRVRVTETEYEGETKRMLIMDLPTILFSTVEVLLDQHFTCKAEFIRSNGPPAPYDLYLFHSMHGLSVRKWGIHKPSAMMFWSTPRDLARQALPHVPLVGSCVYVPGVRLELSVLPDLGFEDLRLVDLPQPIVSVGSIQAGRYPKWMKRGRVRGFKDWDSHGPIPPDLRLRFPDL